MDGVEFATCPVGTHYGKVEHKIRLFMKTIDGSRLSINNQPITIGNIVDVENLDILTPNRLRLALYDL